MAFLTRGVLAALLAASTTAFAQAADRAIIVLDASGSMWGQVDGKPKVEIARESLRTVLQSVPAGTELGLMAYGHREKGSCTDIELVVPPAAGSAPSITAAADAMKFQGKTPLTAAVRQAAEALRYTEQKSTVILITDGVETCEADPCALGKELEAAGVDFTAHVVGFGLTAEEGREVACLAENTGGRYLQASNAAALKEALAAAVGAPSEPAAEAPSAEAPAAEALPAETSEAEPAPEGEPPAAVVAEPAPEPAPAETAAPEPARPEFNFIPKAVMAAGGEPLENAGNAWEIYKAKADGGRGELLSTEYGAYKGSLEPGDYVVVARLGEARAEQKLTVEPGEVYTPLVVLDAGTLVVRPRANEGAEVDNAATVVVEHPGSAVSSTNYGETKVVLPAGEQKLTVKLGTGEVSETVQLAAGQTVEKDVVVGVGHVTVNALYAEDGEKVDGSGLDIKIFRSRQNVDGTRDQVSYGFGPDAKFALAPGDHVAVLRMDRAETERPFNIRAGETKEVTAILDAGVLIIDAPAAKDIKVFPKKDGQGERKEIAYGFGGALQTTVPAGDYIIATDRRDGSPVKETPVSVKAGGRLELTIQ
ncbi:VWA domain-containing protein [Mesorhizobium sp. YM1C-6-2]|uniref:vWA domain-containing protein n=1 Tax=Mesorhizobium sp. YM1C-6-2 TaxID=1827501 RepID=UPI000EF24937|nr:VWA domain-containing protein [Mesorhizobium sp. YM1C-6-2]RLP22946.1 VWA domain-containing protein [Mesorhizobium sp. YM1C-6-2]